MPQRQRPREFPSGHQQPGPPVFIRPAEALHTEPNTAEYDQEPIIAKKNIDKQLEDARGENLSRRWRREASLNKYPPSEFSVHVDLPGHAVRKLPCCCTASAVLHHLEVITRYVLTQLIRYLQNLHAANFVS